MKKYQNISAILFDMDDTILRLGADWGSVKEKIRAIYKHCGGELEIPPGQLLYTINKIAEKYPDAADAMLKLVAEHELAGVENARLIADKNLLASLRKKYVLGIVSSNCRSSIENALQKFGIRDLFSAVVSREDCKLKPDPSGIIAALKLIGVAPEKTIYVGDKDTDFFAAKAANTHFVGVGLRKPGEIAYETVNDFMSEADKFC